MNKTLKTRQCISIILCIIMIFSVLPLEVLAAHTHNNDSLNSPNYDTYNSIDRNYHEKQVYSGLKECSCGNVIVPSIIMTVKEKHSLDNYNTCTQCKTYFEPIVNKEHIHKTESKNTVIKFESNNSELHTRKIFVDKVCSICNVTLGKNTSTAEKQENHNFYTTSENDSICKDCGYKKVHEHIHVQEQNSTTYIDKGEFHEKLEYLGRSFCRTCPEVFKSSSYLSNNEKHTYGENGICTLCAAAIHVHNYVQEGNYFEYIANDSYCELREYSGIEKCNACNEILKQPIIIKTVQLEHDYDDDNNECKNCGYYKAHEHKWICEPDYTNYIQKDIYVHEVQEMFGKTFCSCGVETNPASIKRTYWEDHKIRSDDGMCQNCGFQAVLTNLEEPQYILESENHICEADIFVEVEPDYGYIDNDRHDVYYYTDKAVCAICDEDVIPASVIYTRYGYHYSIFDDRFVCPCGYGLIDFDSLKKTSKERFCEEAIFSLDVLGMIPVYGEIADAANVVVSIYCNDYASAFLSLASIVPLIDPLTKTIKASKYQIVDDIIIAGYKSADFQTNIIKNANKHISSETVEWLGKGASDTGVYFGIKDGIPDYVGMTKQTLKRRHYQHIRYGGKDLDTLDYIWINEIQLDHLTINQAHAIEQYYIHNFDFIYDGQNINNSIAIDQPYYDEALEWAEHYINGLLYR